MRDINAQWFNDLLAEHKPPCVSIYLPTPRANPPAAESARLFEHLLHKAEQQLGERFNSTQIRQMTQKIRGATVDADPQFWTGDRDAVAIFASPDFVQVIDLQHRVDAYVEVADSFHVKPLIRVLQSANRFQLLCLTQQMVEVLEGDQYRLDRLPNRNLPQNINELPGMIMSKEVSVAQDLRDAKRQPNDGQDGAGTLDQFLRVVDKAVWENYSRASKLPLILVAVEAYHAHFRDISKNTYLLEEGIKIDPKNVSLDRLREEAWKIMEPRYNATVERITNDFMAAKARHRGSDEVMEVAQAASQGRVDTLLVQADAQIAGHLMRTDGFIEPAKLSDPYADDVLDDLAEMVLKMDGQVLVLPRENMPTDSGVAAIYRY